MRHLHQNARLKKRTRNATYYINETRLLFVMVSIILAGGWTLLGTSRYAPYSGPLSNPESMLVASHIATDNRGTEHCWIGGDGILMILMSTSARSGGYNMAIQGLQATVESFRTTNAGIPLALMTDIQMEKDITTLFDCVLPGDSVQESQHPSASEDDILWQLSSSPFERTLVLPTDTIVCADLRQIFTFLKEYDMLVMPSLEPPYVDLTSTMAFRAGARFDTFTRTLRRVLPLGSGPIAMDLALRTMDPTKVTVGVLPANWRLTLYEYQLSAHTFAHSMVLSEGPIYATTSNGMDHKNICTWVNKELALSKADAYDGRVLTFDQTGLLWQRNASISGLAACTKMLGAKVCSKDGMLWSQGTDPITFGSHSAQHRRESENIQALQSRLAAQHLSYGVSYFGYSVDPQRLVRYIAEVEKSAWSFKMFNPRTRIALFTNLDMAPVPPFDDIVHMDSNDIKPVCCKRNASWNILARVQYHGHSPYNLTVQIDSDRVVYGDISPLFIWLAHDYDLLGVSGGNLPDMDLGIFGLKKNERTEALLEAWIIKMKQLGHEGVDDQYSFTRVRDTIPGLRVGFLNPRWQMKYAPPRPFSHAVCDGHHLSQCNITHTLIMRGKVMIAAGSYTTLDSLVTNGRLLNRASVQSGRVLVRDLLAGRYADASTYEKCVNLTRNQCNHPELDWGEDDYDVLSLTEAQTRYPKVGWRVK